MHVRRSDKAADRGRPWFRRDVKEKPPETTQIHPQDIAGDRDSSLLAHIADLSETPASPWVSTPRRVECVKHTGARLPCPSPKPRGPGEMWLLSLILGA